MFYTAGAAASDEIPMRGMSDVVDDWIVVDAVTVRSSDDEWTVVKSVRDESDDVQYLKLRVVDETVAIV